MNRVALIIRHIYDFQQDEFGVQLSFLCEFCSETMTTQQTICYDKRMHNADRDIQKRTYCARDRIGMV